MKRFPPAPTILVMVLPKAWADCLLVSRQLQLARELVLTPCLSRWAPSFQGEYQRPPWYFPWCGLAGLGHPTLCS